MRLYENTHVQKNQAKNLYFPPSIYRCCSELVIQLHLVENSSIATFDFFKKMFKKFSIVKDVHWSTHLPTEQEILLLQFSKKMFFYVAKGEKGSF